MENQTYELLLKWYIVCQTMVMYTQVITNYSLAFELQK